MSRQATSRKPNDQQTERQKVLDKRAQALRQPLSPSVRNTVKVLVFAVGPELFGMPASKIKEILKAKRISRIPGAPAHISGVMNLRGEIISVTDLAKLIDLASAPEAESYFIVVDSGEAKTAILADQVEGIFEIGLEEIEPTPTGDDRERESRFFEGLVRRPEHVFSVLHLDTVLSGGNSGS